MEHEIKSWLLKPDYKTGVQLYEKVGTDKFLLGLLRKYETSYTEGKLYDALNSIYEQIISARVAAPVVAQPAPDFFSLPVELQKLNIEKGQLYRECFAYRSALKKIHGPKLHKVIKSKMSITVRDACELMKATDGRKKPQPFSISYVTCDLEKDTGGELISFEHCTLSNLNFAGSSDYTASEHDKLKRKNPRHWYNGTRNIKPLGSDMVRKLHIWLIYEFNGMAVTLSENS
jgi:hypothetical protein